MIGYFFVDSLFSKIESTIVIAFLIHLELWRTQDRAKYTLSPRASVYIFTICRKKQQIELLKKSSSILNSAEHKQFFDSCCDSSFLSYSKPIYKKIFPPLDYQTS